MRLMKHSIALAIGVVSMVAAPAFAVVKVGVVVSATGPASFLGEPQRQAVEMVAKQINDSGGINGEKLQLFVYDDGSNANASRNFAVRLVEDDKVDAIVGGSGTGNSLAMIPVVERAQIPFVSFSGGVEIIDPVREWVFKPPHTDLMACEKIFADMGYLQLTKAALISGQGGFAKSMTKRCEQVAPSYGIEIVSEESYGPRDSDMTPQLNRIRQIKGVQAVIDADVGQGLAIVTRNFRQLGMQQILYMSHPAATQGYLEAVGKAGEGIRIPAPLLLVADSMDDNDPYKRVLTKFRDGFVHATGHQPDAFAGYAYDGLMLLVDAMKRAGTSDPKAVRDALEATDGFVGTVGRIKMSPTDHLGITMESFRMMTIKDGRWQLVESAKDK